MPKGKKSIVVLGAGIAGLRVVQRLQKHLPATHEIILVDKSLLHVFSSDLYQVATVFSKEITESCLARIKETVATPIPRLVDPWKVSFIQSEITGIDPKKKKVFLKSGVPLRFDTLVVALGSVTNTFNVPGVKDYAFPLKTVTDALAINCQIDHLFHQRYKDKSDEAVVITIAGGGSTGVEVAGELMGTLHKLCKKYKHDPKRVTVQLVQAGDDLAAFDEQGTRWIKEELEALGVKLYMGHRVIALEKKKIRLLRKFDDENTSLPCHMLIWTCGVQVNPVVVQTLGDPKAHGAIPVRSTLEARDYSGVFALGDCARIPRTPHSKEVVPMMAQYAMKEADCVAKNILRQIKHQPLKQFHMGLALYVVPVGFNFTLFKVGNMSFRRFWTQMLKPIITLKYALAILPFRKAWQKFRLGGEIWEQNDL